MGYSIQEIPGTKYQSLEEYQQAILIPLARLISDLILGDPELSKVYLSSSAQNGATIEPKKPEVNDV